MATSTLSRDFDIARIIADYERRISSVERRLLAFAYLTPEFTDTQACRATRTAAQSITDNSVTTVAFTSEIFDNNDMHDNVTNNSRITINVAGIYVVGFNGSFATGADYVRTMSILRLNGAGGMDIGRTQTPGTSTNTVQQLGLSTVYEFVAGDFIEVQVYQDNTANVARDLLDIDDQSPHFWAARIGS